VYIEWQHSVREKQKQKMNRRGGWDIYSTTPNPLGLGGRDIPALSSRHKKSPVVRLQHVLLPSGTEGCSSIGVVLRDATNADAEARHNRVMKLGGSTEGSAR
jgi:hypothetical protein